jgi:hypothetical protein
MIELLLALLVTLTGITRDVDPGLTTIAQERVVEISACPPEEGCFDHEGRRGDAYEVLAWNAGYDDPIARIGQQWRESSEHWAILSSPELTHIGCAVRVVEDRTYAACVLLPLTLPNTAMEAPRP